MDRLRENDSHCQGDDLPAHILPIEDNRHDLELMAYMIRAYGHTPLSTGWGEAGVGVALTQSQDRSFVTLCCRT